MKKSICIVASLLLLPMAVNATSIGYSKDKIVRTNVFRLGSTTKQGQMIRFSKAKLQALKGKSIDFAEFVVGSKNTVGNSLDVFLSTSPDGEPMAKGTVKVDRAFSKCKWTLDTPYVITGDEENLYVGYTAEIPTTYKLLISDGSYDIKGYNFAYQDGEWVDTYGMNRGSAHISVNVDGASDYTDAIVARSNFDGYYKAGNKYEMVARFINAGTTVVNSFDAVVNVGGTTTTQHFADQNINPKDCFSFKLQNVDSSNEGSQNINVEIANVNGGNNDVDPSDNSVSASLFFYPKEMERSLLVEGFTGQDCTQCPAGHVTISSVLDAYANAGGEKVVEVSHHAGFYPDMFTMTEDDSYRFYYSAVQTFAPAVMVNRSTDTSVNMAPVISVGSADLAQLITHAEASKPYVSLNLETSLNKETRNLDVKLQIKPHTEMPSDKMLFNVFLVQDNISAYQANGGTNYNHNRVFRGTLTDNAWGIILDDLTPGKVTTWEKTITVPEKIRSSYWTEDLLDGQMYGGKYVESQLNWDAVLDNMTLVAFVAEYDTQDNTKNIVYNCCEVKLGDSYKQGGFGNEESAINTVTNNHDADIRVKNGRISVGGNCSRLCVYNIAGRQMNTDTELDKGVYIVKAVVDGKQTTKKILVK